MSPKQVQKNKKVPELRFPGFSDEWKEKKLENIGDVVGGGTPNTFEPAYWNGDIEWFTPSEIKEKYIATSRRKISQSGLQSSSARILPKGSLLFSSRATVGEISICLGEATTNQGFQSIIVNNKNINEFWYYWIVLNKNSFLRKAHGSTFLEISGKEMKKLKTISPTIEEQEKIAYFLTTTDLLLENMESQKKELEQYKKGITQKIFANEIRFKDENGRNFPDWKEKKLIELVTESNERAGNHGYELLSLSIKKGLTSQSESIKKDNSNEDKTNYKVVRPGQIAYNTMRMWQGASVFVDRTGIVSPAYTVLNIDKGSGGYYKSLFKLQRSVFDFYRYSQGLTSDTWNLKYKHLKEVPVLISANLNEQSKIASFLDSLDDIIKHKKKEIEKMKEWKKGLLQKMFI